MSKYAWILLLTSCTTDGYSEADIAAAADCGIELVEEEDYDLGEFEPTELAEYEPPAGVSDSEADECAEIAQQQEEKARENGMEEATSDLLSRNSPRWEVYEHICTASEMESETEVALASVPREKYMKIIAKIQVEVEPSGYMAVTDGLPALGNDETYTEACDCAYYSKCRLTIAFID